MKAFVLAHDPRKRFWGNPLRFFSAPPLLSWCEVIDETGQVRDAWVMTSNQSKENDRRIIESCVDGKWTPARHNGRNVASLRTRNINYGDSPFVVGYWWKRIDNEGAIGLSILLAALTTFGITAMVRRWRGQS